MALDSLLAVLFQTHCLLCPEPALPIRFCETGHCLELLSGEQCLWCGEPLGASLSACGHCEGGGKYSVPTRSRFVLTDDATALIHRIKYDSFPELLELVLPSLTEWRPFAEVGDDLAGFTLVPVPLHPDKLWRRGFNVPTLLAVALGSAWKLPVNFGLKRVKAGDTQAGLSRRDRIGNLKGIFAWGDEEPPERVLLVDDVYTTGATLESSAAPIRKRKVKEVRALTVFRTPLKF